MRYSTYESEPVNGLGLREQANGDYRLVEESHLAGRRNLDNLDVAPHVGVQQPIVMNRVAIDTADLSQRYRKFMLMRIWCELLQQLTGRHHSS